MRSLHRASRGLVLTAIAVVAAATANAGEAAPAADAQATVVGAVTGGTHNFGLTCGVAANQTCASTNTNQSVSPAHSAPGGATVPSAGVITSWTLSHGPVQTGGGGAATTTSLTVALRVIRGAGAAGVGAGTGPTEQLPQTPGTYSFAARLPVQPGDRIGYDLRFTPGNLTLQGAIVGTPGDVAGFASAWPDGQTPTSYVASTGPEIGANVYLPMNVTVEPDADGDQYGDLTQDLCTSNGTTHGQCPDTVPPETTITKQPAKKSAKTKAKFTFGASEPGSTFECSLSGKGLGSAIKQFHACTSPRSYKHLDPGKYTFQVRAADAAGNVDASPATAKFRVTAPKG